MGAGIFGALGGILFFFAPNLANALRPDDPKVTAGPAVTITQGGSGNTNTVNNYFSPRADSQSASSLLSFQKYALFWVRIEENIYQIGVVTKLFNPNNRPIQITGLVFNGRRWSFFPRGSYNVMAMRQNGSHAELLEDNYLKPASDAYFKQLLPLKFEMRVNGGLMPELVLRGKWGVLLADSRTEDIVPNVYSVHEQPISSGDWDNILKPQSPINVEALTYKPFPPEPGRSAQSAYYLVFNPDRSATISNPYYDHTPYFKGEAGVMTFIGASGILVLDPGWQILGRTYAEVWSDPVKLKLYNSIFPPEQDGLPRPFGFFAGAENTMAGKIDRPLSAATTRAADKLDFNFDGVQKHEADDEAQRRVVLGQLTREYILTHDGISPQPLAGLELPPKDWLNKRLEELELSWRVPK